MTANLRKTRFPRIPIEAMNDKQRAVAEQIIAGRRMGGTRPKPSQIVGGPFNTWLQCPELASRLERVGDYVRFESSLSARLSEFAILLSARHWTAQFEWYMHEPLAIAAGLRPQIVADVAAGTRPGSMADDEEVVYDFCTELRNTRVVSDETFTRAVSILGQPGVVDLIATSGYYDLVSMTLNVAEMSVPRGEPQPLLLLGANGVETGT